MNYPNFFTCVLVFMMSFLVPASLVAQETPRELRHAFEVSYGLFPVLEIKTKMGGAGGWGSSWSRETYRPIGAINMGYTLDMSKHLQIGVTCSYLNINDEYSSRNPGSSYEYRVERTKSLAIMPKVSIKWYNKENGAIYSSGAVGADVGEKTIKENSRQNLDEKRDLKKLAYHVTLLGAKLGNKKGFFAELGFGYAGVLSGGFYYKL